jgi:hypothetical protein
MSAALQLSLWEDASAADNPPEPRISAHVRRIGEFDQRFRGWQGALPEACAALFSLNRFCKHAECSWQSREEIYDLKNRLVKLLYKDGYCTAAWEHRLVLPAKICRDCGGSGDGGCCDRCDGTGEYLPAKTVRFICFRFEVGVRYTWHQPVELVRFPVTMTDAPADWQPGEREKPVPMPRRQFAAAKDLIRWVLEQSGKLRGDDKAQGFEE